MLRLQEVYSQEGEWRRPRATQGQAPAPPYATIYPHCWRPFVYLEQKHPSFLRNMYYVCSYAASIGRELTGDSVINSMIKIRKVFPIILKPPVNSLRAFQWGSLLVLISPVILYINFSVASKNAALFLPRSLHLVMESTWIIILRASSSSQLYSLISLLIIHLEFLTLQIELCINPAITSDSHAEKSTPKMINIVVTTLTPCNLTLTR